MARKKDEQIAEQWLRDQEYQGRPSALVRHYCIEQVTDDIEQFTGVALTQEQTARIVQKLRDEHNYGPIDDFNQPYYIDQHLTDEEYQERSQVVEAHKARDAQISDQQPRPGLLGWLLG